MLYLNLGLYLKKTYAEGPGARFALWTQGCSLHCKHCCNPELLKFEGGQQYSIEALMELILQSKDIEGVSILGGEPLDQTAAIIALCKEIQNNHLSTMLYTGYTVIEIENHPEMKKILDYIDLLVDGRYEHSLADTKRRWIGSTNQQLHFLTNFYSPEDTCFFEADSIEIHLENNIVTINGKPWGKGLP